MHTGMLWLRSNKQPLEAEIKTASEYYQKKYGRVPDTCLVNPSALDKTSFDVSGITVRPYRPVLPGHLWLGIEDKA